MWQRLHLFIEPLVLPVARNPTNEWNSRRVLSNPLSNAFLVLTDTTNRNVATMGATAASVTVKMILITLPVEGAASSASILRPNVWTSLITLAAEELWNM